MELSAEKIKDVAALAHLEIRPEDEKNIVQHLNKILEYVELLNEIDTSNVKLFCSPAKEHIEMYTEVFLTHPDIPGDSLGADEILKNAPSKHQNQFSVEAVIEEN